MRLSMLVRYSYCIAVVGLSLLAAPALAVSVEDLPTPKPNGWVNDTVDLLSPATEAEINRHNAVSVQSRQRCTASVK